MRFIVGTIMIGVFLGIALGNAAEPATKFGKAELSKFRLNVKPKVTKDKGKKSGGGTQIVEHVVLNATFDNKLNQEVQGLQIMAFAFGLPYKGSKKDGFRVVDVKVHPSVNVPAGTSKTPMVILDINVTASSKTKMNGNGGGTIYHDGSTYEGYFVVVKDASGEVIQLIAKDSKARKFAVEVASTKEGALLGLDASMKFDRYGNRVLKK